MICSDMHIQTNITETGALQYFCQTELKLKQNTKTVLG